MAFKENFDPEKENLWIAENRSQKVGSMAMVNNGKGVAQFRWLLVEASARENGIGENWWRQVWSLPGKNDMKKLFS